MSATIQPRTSTVVIYQGDYLDRLRHLEQQAEAIEQAGEGPQRSGTKSEYAKIREEHEALKAEAEDAAIRVVVKQVGRKLFRELRDKFPPRDGNDGDQAIGVNEDDFFDAFVPVALAEPKFETRAEAAAWTESLSPVDWARVKWEAWSINTMMSADPKSLPTSRPTEDYSEI